MWCLGKAGQVEDRPLRCKCVESAANVHYLQIYTPNIKISHSRFAL